MTEIKIQGPSNSLPSPLKVHINEEVVYPATPIEPGLVGFAIFLGEASQIIADALTGRQGQVKASEQLDNLVVRLSLSESRRELVRETFAEMGSAFEETPQERRSRFRLIQGGKK